MKLPRLGVVDGEINQVTASKGQIRKTSASIKNLPRLRLRVVKQTLFALIRDPPSTFRLVLFAQFKRPLYFLFLPTRLLLALWSLWWSLGGFAVALAGPPPTGHAITHPLPPTSRLGQILVVREQSGEVAGAGADVCTNVAAGIVDVLKFGKGLDEVDVVAKVLCNFGRATV